MGRANKHGADLNDAIQAFYKTQPYEIVAEYDPNPANPLPDVSEGQWVFRARMRDPIPTEIALLAGEVMQSLRSALDYVAWQLALAVSDTPPPTTAFPIFGSKKLYERDRNRFIGGIEPTIWPLFDALQPYHAGDGARDEALWVLHRLANDDKHKIPHVVGSLPSGIGVSRPPGVDLAVTMTIGPFEDDDEVGTVGVIAGADPDTDLHVSATFAVAFGKDTPANGRHLTDEIDRIGREVDTVIRKFEPFFAAS